MTLSTGPWWWAPVFALGWMTTVPAQSFSAPARACVIAAARFIPGVCGVLMSSSSECTTRTPSYFHFGSEPVVTFSSFGGGGWVGRRKRLIGQDYCYRIGGHAISALSLHASRSCHPELGACVFSNSCSRCRSFSVCDGAAVNLSKTCSRRHHEIRKIRTHSSRDDPCLRRRLCRR